MKCRHENNKSIIDPDNLNPSKKEKASEDDDMDGNVVKKVPMKIVQVEGVHQGLKNIKYSYIDVEVGKQDKIELLLGLLAKSRNKREKVMIFCNTVTSCRAVLYKLNDTSSLTSGSSSINENQRILFTYHGDLNSIQRREEYEGFRDTSATIMVATDIAARGIDIPNVSSIFMHEVSL